MATLNFNTLYGKSFAALIAVITAVLIVQGTVLADKASEYKPKENQPCDGEPLYVDYPFYGGMLDPHACAPQCEDNVQRYIVYTNGKATQCGSIPGCLDWGEDHGVTCEVDEEVILQRPRD